MTDFVKQQATLICGYKNSLKARLHFIEAAQLVCKYLASYIHEKDEMIVDFTAVFPFLFDGYIVCCNVYSLRLCPHLLQTITNYN